MRLNVAHDVTEQRNYREYEERIRKDVEHRFLPKETFGARRLSASGATE